MGRKKIYFDAVLIKTKVDKKTKYDFQQKLKKVAKKLNLKKVPTMQEWISNTVREFTYLEE